MKRRNGLENPHCGGCTRENYPVKWISFQITKSKWETFILCNDCNKEIVDKATLQIKERQQRGKQFSQSEANILLGKIAAKYCFYKVGETREHTRQADEYFEKLRKGNNMILFFKDGDSMGIQTNAPTESEFRDEFCESLAQIIESKKFEHDWEFQLRFWLAQFVDLCCVYRGYKHDGVRKSMVLSIGNTDSQDWVFEHKPTPLNKPVLEGFVDRVNGLGKVSVVAPRGDDPIFDDLTEEEARLDKESKTR